MISVRLLREVLGSAAAMTIFSVRTRFTLLTLVLTYSFVSSITSSFTSDFICSLTFVKYADNTTGIASSAVVTIALDTHLDTILITVSGSEKFILFS